MDFSSCCAVCWERIEGASRSCPGCRTAYHDACLKSIGSCAVPGCPAGVAHLPARTGNTLPAQPRGTPQRMREAVARLRAAAPVIVPLLVLQLATMAVWMHHPGFLTMVAAQLVSLLSFTWTAQLAARPGELPASGVAMLAHSVRLVPRLVGNGLRAWLQVVGWLGLTSLALHAPGPGALLAIPLGYYGLRSAFRLHLVPFLMALPPELGGEDSLAESRRLTDQVPGLLLRGQLGLWVGLLPLHLGLTLVMSGLANAGYFMALLLVLPVLQTALQAFATSFTMVLVEDARAALPAAA